MEREDQGQPFEPARTTAPRHGLQVAALVLAGVAGLVVIACWRVPDNVTRTGGGGSPALSLARLFPKWDKPEFALVLSGQQHGYLQPCGCSKPQFGGLTRRYNFLQLLKGGGWPTLGLDLGDVPQRDGLQRTLKFTTSMKALQLMDYSAVGIGENEMGMPLIEALAHWPLNNPKPQVLAANLLNRRKNDDFNKMNVGDWQVKAVKQPFKVGVIATVGPSVLKRVKDPDCKFESNLTAIPRSFKEMRAKKPNFLVLLYQGSVAEARKLVAKFPQFNVIVCVSEEEEPPSVPEKAGNTAIITLGHKGRYVGVVGVYRTGNAKQPFLLRYQLVPLGEELDTPQGQAKNHPVMKLMEDYAREVKRKNYLAEALAHPGKHPVQLKFPKSTYVGSQVCKKCHEEEYRTWEKSPHFHAYKTLKGARNPSLRQYDSECVSCHVTGWDKKGGFVSEAKSKLLLNNGCENCHGPCSEHVKNAPGPQALRDLMNPYRYDPEESAVARTRRLNGINDLCMKCHDIENDVHWKFDKWWKIVHSEDRKGNGGQRRGKKKGN
jgi:hypothetical protein